MATKEQIQMVLKKIEEVRPTEIFECAHEAQVGIGAVLKLIHESDEMVTAGKISEVLHISTARVAVLLKKMVAKGLIIKETSEKDARVTVVKLSDLGEERFIKMYDELIRQVNNVIDAVGEERILEFLEISNEIRQAVKPLEITL